MSGRATKVDLQQKLCLALKISTTGVNDSLSPLVKASIPPDVIPFYQRVGSFAVVSTSDAKLWTKDLRSCPDGFCYKRLENYLINSPDKAFNGDSMRSYKALRAYQLHEDRHVHSVEFCPTWPDAETEESPLCFFCALCFPSQDAQKQPYRVCVCMDKRNGQPYGAHCRCVSGLGEACSHVAGLLFAVNDFILRGFRSLPDSQSTMDVLCKWSKPSEGRKVDAVPLSEVPVRKAVSGGRKAQTKWERDDPLSKYDPRLPETRHVVVDGDDVVCLAEELRAGVGYCGLVRNYDNELRLPEATMAATRVCGPKSLPDTVLEFDCAVLPSSEIELSATSSFSTQRSESLLEKRQALLFHLAGPVPVLDDEAVPGLAKRAERITEAMRLSTDEIEDLTRSTVAQSDSERWHAEHVGCITASLSHRAMRAAASRAPDVVRDTMRCRETQNGTRKQLTESDPRQHGLRLEPLARQAYVQHKHRQGQDVSVDEYGLLVSQAHPYMASNWRHLPGYEDGTGTFCR